MRRKDLIGSVAALAVAATLTACAEPQPMDNVDTSVPHPPSPLTVAVGPLKTPAGQTPEATGTIAEARGGDDAALVERINKTLRAPVEERLAAYRKALKGQAGTVTVKSSLRSLDATRASVRYDISIKSELLWHSTWIRARTATVDLRTGERVRAADLIQPKWLTGKGLRDLSHRLVDGFHGRSCLTRFGQAGELRIRKAAELDGPQIQLAVLDDSLEVIVDTAYYGYETACGQPSAKIPFAELKGVLAEPVSG